MQDSGHRPGEASNSGRRSHGSRPSTSSSSRGRESNGRGGSYGEGSRGSREGTGRNMITGESARDPAGGSGSHARAPVEGFGGENGLFSKKARDPTASAAPAPPPYHVDVKDGDANQGPSSARKDPTVRQVPSGAAATTAASGYHAASATQASLKTSSSAALMAPAFTAPSKRSGAHGANAGGIAGVVLEDPAYLFTDDYPFSADQLDLQKESLLGGGDRAQLAAKKELPQMIPSSKKLLQLTPDMARDLEEWDLECADKHLDAIKDSVATHDDLLRFVLMEGEHPVKLLELAGLEDAPGLFDNVTQRCRLVFTNEKRLVFTQANHSAELGLPKMTCMTSLLRCFHDRWSRRKWSSYYAAINATEILQVVVQQTLTTSYETSACTFNDVFSVLCCPTGGTLYSEKDMDGSTQTLGDHDPGECMSRWDKTRFMRHALVIRYVDCASNSVLETTAMAHPSTPASQLYEMARAIEANITIRTSDWLKNKILPTALPPRAFRNAPPSPPLYRRKSYKILLFVLLVVALIFISVSPTAAVFMIIAVLVALVGSYSNMKSSRKVVRQAANMTLGNVSKTLIGTQGGGLAVYALSFFLALNGVGGDDDDTSSAYSYPYRT